MTQDDTERALDRLLVFMLDDMENLGIPQNDVVFGFEEGQQDREAFTTANPDLAPKLVPLLNRCLSRGYLERKYMGEPYGSLGVTVEGHARALSAKLYKPRPTDQPGVVIHELHASGPLQVGNGNTMNIEAFYSALTAGIDATEASQTEKAEAKSRLSRFLDHPLLCSVVSAVISGGIPLLGGQKP